MRRVVGILSVALITAGCVMLADAGLTLAWKEPVSAIYAELRQNEAQGELDELGDSFLASLGPGLGADERDPERAARRLARRYGRAISNGEGIGTIRLPAAGIDSVFVQGTSPDALERGPGHYPKTGLPGEGTTVGIAGHRTTYGAPFRKIDKPGEGDEVTVEMPYATFTYEVEKTKIVEPTDVEIVRDVGRERIVLTACHPLYSAAQRYAIFGRLIDIEIAEPASP